jgi:hypothetical protein
MVINHPDGPGGGEHLLHLGHGTAAGLMPKNHTFLFTSEGVAKTADKKADFTLSCDQIL